LTAIDPESRESPDLFKERLTSMQASLPPVALRVARFIDGNRVEVLASSAADLAQRIGTSDASVIRAVQALGFSGLPELRKAIAATLDRRATPAENMRRTLTEVGNDSERAIDLVIETHREAIEALAAGDRRRALSEGVRSLSAAERIVVFGLGPSAPLAQYVSILLNRNGRPAMPLNAAGIALADQLLQLRPGDALLLLAYGRPYREVMATTAEGRRLGLPIVLVTDSPEGNIARRADVVIPAARGRAEQVALHAATLAVLEALVLGLAVCDRSRALGALDRLNELRESVVGVRADIGSSPQTISRIIDRDRHGN
jgi:DNA-binding MurR/RpiR family transcriptional regulator